MDVSAPLLLGGNTSQIISFLSFALFVLVSDQIYVIQNTTRTLRMVCIRSKLEACMAQWQDYDTLHDSVSNWVKDTEVKVRNEAGLQSDVLGKRRQVEQFEVRTIDLHCRPILKLSRQLGHLSV